MAGENEAVLKLLVEKDKYEELSKEYESMLKGILSKFFSIGGPLNDNVLGFDNKQRRFLHMIANDIKSVVRR